MVGGKTKFRRSSQTALRYRSMKAVAGVEVTRLMWVSNFVWGVPISPKSKSDQCTLWIRQDGPRDRRLSERGKKAVRIDNTTPSARFLKTRSYHGPQQAGYRNYDYSISHLTDTSIDSEGWTNPIVLPAASRKRQYRTFSYIAQATRLNDGPWRSK